jgi:hypothetical protein
VASNAKVAVRITPVTYGDLKKRLASLKGVQEVMPSRDTTRKLILPGVGRDGKPAFYALPIRRESDEIAPPTIKKILTRFGISRNEWLAQP